MEDISAGLVKSAAEGDMAAFEKIYRLSSGFVYSVALRVLMSHADAEDVVQEVFVKVHANLRNFASRSSFRTWLYRVAMNITINFYNKRKRGAARMADRGGETGDIPSDAADPRESGRDDNERALSALLGRLSPDHRAVIILRELEGLSYIEIARSVGTNVNTVRTRLKRAREALIAHRRREGMGHAV